MPRLVPSRNARDQHETRAQFRDRKQPVQRQVNGADTTGHTTFIARILSNPVLITGSTARWRYAWEEVAIKDDHTVLTFSNAGARRSRSTGTESELTYAINLCELCQATSATKVGPGITVGSLPTGFSLQPIAEHTCVVMHAMKRRSGKPLYAFSMANAIDGTCEALV